MGMLNNQNQNHNQNNNQIDARTLTSNLEHPPHQTEAAAQWRLTVMKDLSSRPLQEQTAIAHAMQTMNDADRKNDPTLPKIDVAYTRATTAEDFKHPLGILPQVAFTHSGDEFVTGIDVEMSPKGILSKDKVPVFRPTPGEPAGAFENPNGLPKDLVKDMNERADQRDKLVAQLTPKQRVQYEKEEEATAQWYKDLEIAPIAFKDHPPETPLHDAIEALSNPHGLSDRQERERDRQQADKRPWARTFIDTGLSIKTELRTP
jgi:hypothetical protein